MTTRTHTISGPSGMDVRRYGRLLAKFTPKVIETEDENKEALAVVESLRTPPGRSDDRATADHRVANYRQWNSGGDLAGRKFLASLRCAEIHGELLYRKLYFCIAARCGRIDSGGYGVKSSCCRTGFQRP